MSGEMRHGFGARRLDVHAAAKIGYLLVFLGITLGLISTILSRPGVLQHRAFLVVSLSAFPVAGAVYLLLLWNRLSWNVLYLGAVAWVVALTTGNALAGPAIDYAGFFYIVAAIYVSYFMSALRAASIVAIAGLAYGIQLAFQEGHASPVARWLYVVGAMVVSVAFVNALVRAAERSAESEKTAREAESRARSELAELNQALEAKVADQVGEMERLGRLRRFLSPNLADVVVGAADESFLEPIVARSPSSSSISGALQGSRRGRSPRTCSKCSAPTTRRLGGKSRDSRRQSGPFRETA